MDQIDIYLEIEELTFSFLSDVKNAVQKIPNDSELGNKVRELSNIVEGKMQKLIDDEELIEKDQG